MWYGFCYGSGDYRQYLQRLEGTVRREWEPEDLIACWTLIESDWSLVGNKTGITRLGFALLLKFFELESRFPRHVSEIPPAAVEYVASQLKVEPEMLGRYRFSGRTFEYHRAQIRGALGFREATVSDEDEFTRWMATEVCPTELRQERMVEALLVRCRAERIEPPVPSRIERIVGSARAAAEQKFCARTVARLSDASAARLEEGVSQSSVQECPPTSLRIESVKIVVLYTFWIAQRTRLAAGHSLRQAEVVAASEVYVRGA